MQTKIVGGQIQGTLTKTEKNKLQAAAEVLDTISVIYPPARNDARLVRSYRDHETIAGANGESDDLDQSPEKRDESDASNG